MNTPTAADSDDFIIDAPPSPPQEPDPATCCGSGCVPCVWDIYDDELKEYRIRLAAWEAQHANASAI